jgi:hypothetical protein
MLSQACRGDTEPLGDSASEPEYCTALSWRAAGTPARRATAAPHDHGRRTATTVVFGPEPSNLSFAVANGFRTRVRGGRTSRTSTLSLGIIHTR